MSESRIARRTMVIFIAAAAAAPALLGACADTGADRGQSLPKSVGRASARHGPAGTLSDPDLVHPTVPWQLTLNETERTTLRALCDLILPADERSPAASALGAHEFIDEWVSAPFEPMQGDAVLVREGLAWLAADSGKRFGVDFHKASLAQQATIADTICTVTGVPSELQRAALFFDRVRELTVIAVYTTREGMADLGYVGNVALEKWELPPPEVLRLVGLL